ncbi:TPA: hypothetical protein QDB26_001915 [Burkholderia vietnamiensis]|uniref:IS1096 element passenger TnpR family protein n=1 Tax=Burkholderia vietnamiensis TaxID=60552 RepID=UPI0009BCEF08|nr:plasmid pRiA4b ORF-3 family protein [Burkholderia vietnamiensis]HDR8926231.1 hypothetical protein [Burkholderia vietnamiensis]HDR9213214.1 hypothetical protein [Burkholderia vietnamiensis]
MVPDPPDPHSGPQLKIKIRGVSPPVWRRLQIPERITITQLHRATQPAMGLSDGHLHLFIIRGWRYGGYRDGGLQLFDGPDTLPIKALVRQHHGQQCGALLT